MISKVVFLVSSPFSMRDYKRYGIEKFVNSGLSVEVLNITPIVYRELHEKAKMAEPYKGDLQKLFSQKDEFLSYIKSFEPSSTHIISTFHFNIDTYFAFKAISKLNFDYSVMALNCVAVTGQNSASRSFVNRLKRLRPSKIKKIIINNTFTAQNSKFLGIKSPRLFLAGGKVSFGHHIFKLCDEKTKALPLHTFDYDEYLDINQNNDEEGKGKIVFIDAPTPRFKFDSYIPGISSPLTEEKYYPSLCKLFDKLEEELGCEVIIAGHPKADHEERPDYFGNRLVVRNKTGVLIKNAKLVINRNSTAINFVVLNNKPVLFHTSDEAQTCETMSNQIASQASWLGKKVVNIDRIEKDDINGLLDINEDLYLNYKNNFIKCENSKDGYMWDIFIDAIKDYSLEKN